MTQPRNLEEWFDKEFDPKYGVPQPRTFARAVAEATIHNILHEEMTIPTEPVALIHALEDRASQWLGTQGDK